jgi:Phage integrase SAM-like domain
MTGRNTAATLPPFVKAAGRDASESYMDFFDGQSLGCASNYRSTARRFFAWAEGHDLTLTSVQQQHVDQFHRHLWEEAGPNMANNSFSLIRRLFSHMYQQGCLTINPAEGLRPRTHIPIKKIKKDLCEQFEVDVGDDGLQAALVMLAPLCIGTFSLKAIRAYTQLPFSTVEQVANRLREQGIWLDGDAIRCEWLDDNCEHPDFAIMMDALVGAGSFDRNQDMAYCLPKERYEQLKEQYEKEPPRVEITRTVRKERREIVTVCEATEKTVRGGED